MKIKFLGTAAAEGIPALFCQCDVCLNAIKNKGKEIRSRCQALIDDQLLIDFGPDTYYHMIKNKVRLDNISHVLITHNHSDHFYSNELIFRRKGYASKVIKEKFHVYGDESAYNETIRVINSEENLDEYVQAIHVEAFKSFNINDYKITPLRANHDVNSSPLIYLIEKEDKSILYAHDTGYFFKQTWDYLASLKKPLSLISLDCTAGLLTNWMDHHLSFDSFMKIIEKMKDEKIIDENTVIVANHFSHNGHATYAKMTKEAKKHNVIVSYDGLEINI
ncbi:MAG: MBL fold metallo-hydrolase [Erysipelotrichaceae bacterium]|nr:MBL fold metallo-hydrolase [Erysipelotrichaceae bacterium]